MAGSLKRGTQIIYVPTHAEGIPDHPDREPGFVTSVRGDHAFCRYWSKYTPGDLRTKANSESTPINCLRIEDTVPQRKVEETMLLYPGGGLCAA